MKISGFNLTAATWGLLMAPVLQCASGDQASTGPCPPRRPNILFYITDDQSWLYTSVSGKGLLNTPGFDRVAREGILFSNAYCPAPSSAPCRAAILTGRYPWQLEEGALLYGGIPRKFPLFSHLLEQAGYESAMCNKGYAPGNTVDSLYHTAPLGRSIDVVPAAPCAPGIANCDYAASFEKFMDSRDTARPFFFWMGVSEPHRDYSPGIGMSSGMEAGAVKVPLFLPDSPQVRSDLLDYFYEINYQDRHLVRILELLESRGELDNTLIIVTSDNGMPFPRAKANLYEYGTHVPLAIRWGDAVRKGRVVNDFISLADIGPTLLGITGIPIPDEMTTKNQCSVLMDPGSGQVDKSNDFTVTAFERHTWCRRGGLTYPMRALRTGEWLLIHNLEPDRWPMGDPPPFVPFVYPDYGDVDESPSKRFMISNRERRDVRDYFALTFSKRPPYELYHVASDPGNLHNLANNPETAKILARLKSQLDRFLERTDDPRTDGTARWDQMPYYILDGKPKAIDRATYPRLY